jgi:hypothetical protein
VLAGVLVNAVATTDMVQREEWRTAGAAFFLRGKLATSAAKDTARRAKVAGAAVSAADAAGAG